VNLEEQGLLVDNSNQNTSSFRDHRDLSYTQPESSKYAMAPVSILPCLKVLILVDGSIIHVEQTTLQRREYQLQEDTQD
jgi:hypothetical protein